MTKKKFNKKKIMLKKFSIRKKLKKKLTKIFFTKPFIVEESRRPNLAGARSKGPNQVESSGAQI